MAGMQLLGFVFCLVFTVASSAPDFKDCSNNPDVTGVTVNGATGPIPFILQRGTNATLVIKFTSKSDSKTAVSKCHGIIGGVPVPFPLSDPDACKDSHLDQGCPVKKGQSYTFTTDIAVLKIYPQIILAVKWEITGDGSSEIVCIEVPAKIE